MHSKKLAVVGGAFAGLALTAGIVRAAVDDEADPFSITIFEPGILGPGVAYDMDAPDAFKLNHELDFMGSVNVHLAHTDTKDFYAWAQQNLSELQRIYPDYDLTNPKEYVPRSLFGRYLRERYAELKAYADAHDISIHIKHHAVSDVQRLGNGQFIVETADAWEQFDTVALTTGNYFKPLDPVLAQTGKYFRPYDYKQYVSDAIAEGSVLLVTGSALSAYDVALYALESGKYSKVIMASRRGMLRKVRGTITPYTRKYVTIAHLETLAGGADKPFRLAHLLQAIKAELKHAYGQDISWKDQYTVRDILHILKQDITAVKANSTLIWRSIHNSLTDDERHEIYARLADEDKQEFVQKYSSLYQLFSAPMPITNAAKILAHIEAGTLELQNGVQSVTYNQEKRGFELHYAHGPNGTPVGLADTSTGNSTHPIVADIYVDASGLGRDIRHTALYQHLIDSGLAASHPLGGIRTDIASRYVIDADGNTVEGLYAIGHMTCGETILPHNSVHLSRVGIAIGADIVKRLNASRVPHLHLV